MAELYARLIVAKKRTYESVPTNLKKEVKKILKSWGYDEHGDPIEV